MKNDKYQRIERERQLKIDEFFDLSLDLNCVTSLEGQILLVNKSWEKATGYCNEELEGQMILDYMHPEDRPKIKKVICEFKKDDSGLYLTSRFRCQGEDYKVFEWALFIYEKKVYATARVCTKYQERCQKFKEIPIEGLIAHERQLFRTVLLSIGDAIISTDQKCQIVLMNKVAEMLTGWSLEEAQGRDLSEVYQIVDTEESKRKCPDFVKAVITTGTKVEIEEISLTRKNGDIIFIQNSVAAIRDQDEKITGAVLVFRDFTEKRERLKQVEYLSFHDYLTGLYNRRYMADAIKRLDQKRNLPLTFMVMDINGLKLINDSFGHEMGDRLIQTVADLIQHVSRADDIIARTGGDEFALILPNTDEEKAEAIKKRFNEKVKKAHFESVIVSVAVGYSVKKKEQEDFELIAKQADDDMYRDKIVTGKHMRKEMVEKILRTINKNYDQEAKHLELVAVYAERIAQALMLEENEISQVKMAAFLHDIGKIAISPDLFRKKKVLTARKLV